MPRLSIVIACLDESEVFETTLASVLQHRPGDCEVIVVHPFAYSDPYALAGEVRFVTGGPDSDILQLLNAGLESASGEVVHFLEPGTQVEADWTDAALDSFRQHQVAAVAPLVLMADDHRRVAYTGVRQGLAGRRRLGNVGRLADRSMGRAQIVGPSLHAAFYRRSTLQVLGGFDAEVGHDAADLDLALKLRQLGFQCVTVAESHVIGPVPERHAQASFAAGRANERVYWRHTASQDRIKSLLVHPLAVATELIANVARGGAVGNLCGRLFAFFDLTGYRRHDRRMERVRSALRVSQDPPEDSDAVTPKRPDVHNRAA